MMAAAKVTPQVLEKLCSDKFIIAFANIKEVNENLREVKFEKSKKSAVSKKSKA